MEFTKNFASDNNSGVHPEIMQAIVDANHGHSIGYGDDFWTEKAINDFKKVFGNDIDVYFVFTGTAANTLGLTAVTNSFNGIICAESSHINIDECGAPENFSGCKLIDIKAENGKLCIKDIEQHLHLLHDEHHVQPKVISITQTTELGTLYSIKEIKELANFAHKNNLLLHLDGARISNAAVKMNLSLKEMTKDCGVDFMSFGGTKNGMMYGEAIIFFNTELSESFKYYRKQGMQLASKMRYISAQFSAFFENDLWKKNALQANKMASLLENEIKKISGFEIVYPVQSNAIFVKMPKKYIKPLQDKFFFYIWDEEENIVRWMCSFDTDKQDVFRFISVIKKIVGNRHACSLRNGNRPI